MMPSIAALLLLSLVGGASWADYRGREAERYLAPSTPGVRCADVLRPTANVAKRGGRVVKCRVGAGRSSDYRAAAKSFETVVNDILYSNRRDTACLSEKLAVCLRALRMDLASSSKFAPTFYLLGAIFEDQKDFLCAATMFHTAAEYGIDDAYQRAELALRNASASPLTQIATCSNATVLPIKGIGRD